MKTIWVYRLSVILLIFLSLFVLMKLEPIWFPFLQGLKVICMPLLISYFIAFLLHPIVEKLHEKGISRTWAILLIYVLFFGGIGFGIYKGYPVIISQMREIGEKSPKFVHMYEEWNVELEEKTDHMPHYLHKKIDDSVIGVEKKVQSLANMTVGIAKGIVNHSIMIILIPFFVFYLLKDHETFKQFFWRNIPKKWHGETKGILQEINRSLGGYIRGQLLVCVFLMIMGTLAFWIIQLRYPLLLGVFVGVTDIIPYFGPIIGAIPALLFAATISVKKIVMVLIIILVLQFIEGNILGPYIVGKSIKIHPVFIILSLLVGGTVGGFVGLLLAVPILVIVKVFITQLRWFFIRRKIEKDV